MANTSGVLGDNGNLPNLTAEEKRLFAILFKQADTKGDGIVTGEIAITLFFKTKLSENTLGEIWAMADTENRGFLLKGEFSKAMRLIGHYQARPGRPLSIDLALQPCPAGFPKFEGINMPPGQTFDEQSQAPAAVPPPPAFPPPAMQAQNSGSVRVPPLTPDRVADYTRLFESGGVQKGGTLDGDKARDFFQRSGLPNNVLAHVWNLADTEQRSALSLAEFIIAMHLLASYRIGALTALPQTLPAGLIEAASRRAAASSPAPAAASAMPRQFSGATSGRTASPLARQAFGAPPMAPPSDWLVGPQEKAGFDQLFDKLDTHRNGYISGDQAVSFFSESGLPQDSLAAIWDLSTVRGLDQLNRDEFAVAMYLIRDQRGKSTPDLPSVIPPNLIPPSMRGIPKSTLQPQSTGFPAAPVPAPVPQQPSAAEDLFGLDALSNPPPTAPVQQQQTTGGSGTGIRSFDDPFGNKATSPTSQNFGSNSPRGVTSSSHFKPFIPSSSFGQGLATQTTGGSGTSSTVQSRDIKPTPSAMDDLLGDNDPEISKKLTNETAELANMSSQIGTLRNQMQDVQNKKSATQNDLNSTNTQRRDLELRLTQFRSQFQQEANAVKALEEELANSRKETRRLQQEGALLEASYQDLQGKHQQAASALENERRENANLKERMRQINAEMMQLRPQLEKMKNDSRHEKGMVSINKKQLEKSETERDAIKNEMDDLSRGQQDGSRGLPESSNVVSPAQSSTSQSTNPFFRKSPQPSFDNTMSPGGFARPASKESNKFDNIFGPSFGTTPTAGSPATSTPFRQQESFPAQSDRSVSDVGVPTPSASPRPTDNLPPPPTSRQMTSSDLPLSGGRNETAASSVRVETPISRYGGNETPTNAASSSPIASTTERTEPTRADTTTSTGAAIFDRKNANASPVASMTSDTSRGQQQEAKPDFFKSFGREIPGAFPDTHSPLPTDADADSLYSQPSRSATTKSDFDSAFASVGSGKQPQARQMTGSSTNGSLGDPALNKFHSEFPPIALNEKPESDSESEPGFDDDFTQASPSHQRKISQTQFDDRARGKEPSSNSFFSTQPTSDPPRPEAQQSPPSYNTSTSPTAPRDFPAEFGGLLPSRDNPLSSTSQAPAQSPPPSFVTPATGGQGHALFGGSSTSKSGSAAPTSTFSVSPPPTSTTPASSTVPSDAYHSAPSHPSGSGTDKGSASTQHSQKPSFTDDFGADFDDLAEAKEDDDDQGDDDFMFTSQHHEGFDEFNPAFDSPAMSKSGTMASERTPTAGKSSGFGDDSFGDFGSDFKSLQASGSSSKPPHDDWDAMMKSISSEPPNTAAGLGKGFEENEPFGSAALPEAPEPPGFGSGVSEPPKLSGRFAGAAAPEAPEPPKLGRSITESSVHDDPSVQRLVSMGYSRTMVVRTLEKYDYDFGKALEDLTNH